MNKLKAQEQLLRMRWTDDIPSLDYTSTWSNIQWKKLEKRLYKLQKRIYRASHRGDIKAVRRLQKTLIRSWSAKMVAVRKVTQENKGKSTAGVDGVKRLSPESRLALAASLKPTGKAKPTRRVWIPKPGKNEKSRACFPTMRDRALQTLLLLTLEPEWEARFEENSFGFRPGRSTHDAIKAIRNAIRYKPKFVLDADIAQCFDRINHTELLRKINTFPTIRRQIRAWLTSGVIDDKQFFRTTEGTPQGGSISPLLANIALHGMEKLLDNLVENIPFHGLWKRDRIKALGFVRYADDFVVIHEDLNILMQCQQVLTEWLKGIGLELKSSKTRITHTLEQVGSEKPGLDFLGFNIRQHPLGKHHSGKKPKCGLLGYISLIKPTKKALHEHYKEVASLIDTHKNAPQTALISKLNPKIIGWSNYYSKANSRNSFELLNHLVFLKLWKWAKRRHPGKSKKWIKNKYWNEIEGNNWCFSTRNNNNSFKLRLYTDTPIEEYVKIQGDRSPYDGDIIYWSKRMGSHPEIGTTEAKLLKIQKGKCPLCKLHFIPGDKWEKDHKLARKLGGSSKYDNLQLLHIHCHDEKTKKDLQAIDEHKRLKLREVKWKRLETWFNSLDWEWIDDIPTLILRPGTHDKSLTTEEPDEVKVSRPVLKTSRVGDNLA